MKRVKVTRHTTRMDVNLYWFPVTDEELTAAGVERSARGGALRVVFGHWLDDALEGHEVLFVEREGNGVWQRCSPELEGDRVETILKSIGARDALETLEEDRDGIEGRKLDLDGDDDDLDGDGDDDEGGGSDGGRKGFALYDMHGDTSLCFTDVTAAELAQGGISVSDGAGPIKLVFGTEDGDETLFAVRRDRWWRPASAPIRGERVRATLEKMGKRAELDFLALDDNFDDDDDVGDDDGDEE